MNSDIKSIEQRVCKMLMEKLPFPDVMVMCSSL